LCASKGSASTGFLNSFRSGTSPLGRHISSGVTEVWGGERSVAAKSKRDSWGTVLTATEIRATAIARGRVIKRVNGWTAVLCSGLPALALGILFPAGLPQWLAGFGVLLWASLFEYAYHRFLLHLPRTFFGRRHLEHHASVGTPTEAEHGCHPCWERRERTIWHTTLARMRGSTSSCHCGICNPGSVPIRVRSDNAVRFPSMARNDPAKTRNLTNYCFRCVVQITFHRLSARLIAADSEALLSHLPALWAAILVHLFLSR
jgi:hypothetical protein